MQIVDLDYLQINPNATTHIIKGGIEIQLEAITLAFATGSSFAMTNTIAKTVAIAKSPFSGFSFNGN
ncbi:hypothetical protein FRE64_04995 [Euhalothece natronophila Z-M001]|uniref:Uncharacterized protein n=1 Tax=Euhalothece natronophila Z-M001 TaxID=522448 RepID=A0A5B8NMK0_9CHRO|nr:hypothetical protein [Euhalothece natronophila]QDZ39339.1 hypothetical protein FRE64_04995 [Euhalothece natronophila Z-M001]